MPAPTWPATIAPLLADIAANPPELVPYLPPLICDYRDRAAETMRYSRRDERVRAVGKARRAWIEAVAPCPRAGASEAQINARLAAQDTLTVDEVISCAIAEAMRARRAA